jgi:hypothetical protein
MSSYLSELIYGLLAVLYLINRICSHYNIQSGKVCYYCNNKGVIQNVFNKAVKPGITFFMEPESELVVEAARKLVDIIPVTIVASWVKGHQPGNKDPPSQLNHQADRLASTFSNCPPPGFHHKNLPTAPPLIIKCGCFSNILPSLQKQLFPILCAALHSGSLKAHIIKTAKWPSTTFDQVNWTAHGRAFQ